MQRARTERGRPLFPWAAILLAVSALALASEVSERLTARAQLAYEAGRHDEARDLFAQAVAADPRDAEAHYGLGLALGKLGRWDEAVTAFRQAVDLAPDFEQARRGLELARGATEHATTVSPSGPAAERSEPAAGEARRVPATGKPWELHAAVGVQYDSNVTISPRGRLGALTGDKDDVGFIFSGGGGYDFLNRADAVFRLDYDIYQTLHPDIDDFDFESHYARGTASYALRPWLWAGVQGGYNYYFLGSDSYLAEPFVLPFLSLLEATWGLTQITYRHGDDTYLSSLFHEVRDGPNDGVGASQTLLDGGGRHLTVGYQYREETPSRRRQPTRGALLPTDFAFVANQGYAEIGFAAWWRTTVDLMYLYENDDYTERNSLAGFRKTRNDNGHYLYASVERPIAPHVSMILAYYGTVNTSNIPAFDYRRHVVSALLQVAY